MLCMKVDGGRAPVACEMCGLLASNVAVGLGCYLKRLVVVDSIGVRSPNSSIRMQRYSLLYLTVLWPQIVVDGSRSSRVKRDAVGLVHARDSTKASVPREAHARGVRGVVGGQWL